MELHTIDTHFRDTIFYKLNSTNSNFLVSPIYILYSFKHGPNPCDIFVEIEKVWFGGYESVSLGPFT